MSVQTEITRIQNAKAAIKEAIEGKGVTVPDATMLDGMAPLIASIQTGGGAPAVSVAMKDVNFYDYDGALVASYTLAEAQALTALPDGPSHDGLMFQGWNWSLEKINALTRPMNVGAMYITDDGKTRLHIRIWDTVRSNVPLYISQTVANGVTIDWGDGSATETLAGTGNVNTTHQYTAVGDYTVTLAPAEGCTLGLGTGSSSYCVMGSTENKGIVYCNLLQDVRIGTNVTEIRGSAFRSCYSLASITIPKGVTRIKDNAFYYCYSLASITIPKGVTRIQNMFTECSSLLIIIIPESFAFIQNYAFYYCYSLASITIPDNVTSIMQYAFYYCYSLASITIPEGVTSIGAYAFNACYGMAEYHLLPTTPPTLYNTNAFNGIPSDCILYVPKGCLEAYQTATNWATYADYMREEAA